MQRVLRSQADFRSTILRNQLTSLILFEAITTTRAKGKQLLPFVNRFFNRVKAGDLNASRLAHETLLDKNAVKKVFEEILPRFKDGETTFAREYRVMPRRGDNSPQTMIALVKSLEVKTAKAAKTTDEPKAAAKAEVKIRSKKAKA
ncbi:MAG TPA: 50S ribosomal protein L17 [Candidatus Saccharimonadales bacterium]|nr:50S ribosomal protein L17 [Candidatus Saccharimonadales bacterium]